ncbi:MAG: hypothetical protein IIA23_11255 [Chloroflexi bacterium]|nr:hypothetical protein [Chloroflexota bacterium]
MPKKFINLDANAAKTKVGEAGKRIAETVSKTASVQGSAVKQKLAAGGKFALAKLTDAGVKLTQKQLNVLEKVKSKYSESASASASALASA